jgi:hypothetical protein
MIRLARPVYPVVRKARRQFTGRHMVLGIVVGVGDMSKDDALKILSGATPADAATQAAAYAAYYGSGGAYSQAPSVQAAAQQQAAGSEPTAQPVALPSPTYQTPAGYNSTQYADLATAQQLAQALGGKLVQTTSAGPFNVAPQYLIDFGNGVQLDAGLLAKRYSTESKALADQETSTELYNLKTGDYSYNNNIASAPGYTPVSSQFNPPAASNTPTQIPATQITDTQPAPNPPIVLQPIGPEPYNPTGATITTPPSTNTGSGSSTSTTTTSGDTTPTGSTSTGTQVVGGSILDQIYQALPASVQTLIDQAKNLPSWVWYAAAAAAAYGLFAEHQKRSTRK